MLKSNPPRNSQPESSSERDGSGGAGDRRLHPFLDRLSYAFKTSSKEVPRSGSLFVEIERPLSVLGLGCEEASLMLPTFYPCPDQPEHPMQYAR
jgi:hypothetical protein